MEKKEAERN